MDSLAFSTVSSAIGLVVPCLILLGCFWILWRTQSRHVFIYRLWRLVHGSQEISDPEVSAYVNEQTSLMSFRFMSGVPVTTLGNAHQLIQWTKAHNIEMSNVALCGGYFDPDLRRIRLDKLPSTLMQKARILFTALVFLTLIPCLSATQIDDALLQLKSTGQWFRMRSDEAHTLLPFGALPIRKVDCTSDVNVNASRTQFSSVEVRAVCELFGSSDISTFIQKTVNEQKILFTVLFCYFFIVAFFLFISCARMFSALSLAKRGLDPALPGDQLDLNFMPVATLSRPKP